MPKLPDAIGPYVRWGRRPLDPAKVQAIRDLGKVMQAREGRDWRPWEGGTALLPVAGPWSECSERVALLMRMRRAYRKAALFHMEHSLSP